MKGGGSFEIETVAADVIYMTRLILIYLYRPASQIVTHHTMTANNLQELTLHSKDLTRITMTQPSFFAFALFLPQLYVSRDLFLSCTRATNSIFGFSFTSIASGVSRFLRARQSLKKVDVNGQTKAESEAYLEKLAEHILAVDADSEKWKEWKTKCAT